MAQMSHQLKRGTVSSSLKREPYCTVGYRCQPLLSGADWQRVQMARKSSQISKWSLQGWRFLPPLPPSPLRWGVGHRPTPAYTFQTEACRELKATIEIKIKLQRTTDTFKQYMTDATHLVVMTEIHASVKSLTAPGNIKPLSLSLSLL